MSSELFGGILFGMFAAVPSSLIAIAAYVLSSMTFYTVACRRGLNHPWLAWIPVVKNYLIGSVSDQYRYVVRRERKNKRGILLALSILRAVLGAIALGLLIAVISRGVRGFMWDYSERRIMEEIMESVAGLIYMSLPLCAVSIAYWILRYMALFDIYRSLDPGNGVLYLVLSILIRATEPFFLFFNRSKDDGMPPRKKSAPVQTPPEPQWQPTQDRPDPWEQSEPENKDYL